MTAEVLAGGRFVDEESSGFSEVGGRFGYPRVGRGLRGRGEMRNGIVGV